MSKTIMDNSECGSLLSPQVGDWVFTHKGEGRVMDIKWDYISPTSTNRANRLRVMSPTGDIFIVWHHWSADVETEEGTIFVHRFFGE